MSYRKLVPLLLLLLTAPAARADNPFGLMLWPEAGQDLAMTAARAAALGVAWYRPPTLFIDRWRGNGACPACRSLSRSGLSLAITIRNGGRDAMPRRPSTPPADLDSYGKTVAAILAQWKPAMLVVEDEENKPLRFADGRALGVWDSGGGTALGYRRELETACQAAHAQHSLCSNGGLSFDAVTALTWITLLREGKADQACDYARRAFLGRLPTACSYRRADDIPSDLRESLLQNAEVLLPVYRASPIDAVNFHWYGGDAVALAQTIDTLARLVGKPAMSNEIGQHRSDADPSHVRPLMRAALAGGMKLAIWFSVDGDDSVSLFEGDGRLRPAGNEFIHQMSGRK